MKENEKKFLFDDRDVLEDEILSQIIDEEFLKAREIIFGSLKQEENKQS